MAAEVGVKGKAKIQMKSQEAFTRFFGIPKEGDIMHPVSRTCGPVLPYTPGLNVGYDSIYTAVQPMHSNFAYPVFQHHSLQPITVSFTLVADTQENARYSLAVYHFIRSVMKMHQDGRGVPDYRNLLPGTPPPVLNFSAYGEHMFHNVPVVIENFNFSVTNDKNMVEVVTNRIEENYIDSLSEFAVVRLNRTQDISYVPVDWDMAISLRPAFSPKRVREEFGTRSFTNGSLLRKGYQ